MAGFFVFWCVVVPCVSVWRIGVLPSLLLSAGAMLTTFFLISQPCRLPTWLQSLLGSNLRYRDHAKNGIQNVLTLLSLEITLLIGFNVLFVNTDTIIERYQDRQLVYRSVDKLDDKQVWSNTRFFVFLSSIPFLGLWGITRLTIQQTATPTETNTNRLARFRYFGQPTVSYARGTMVVVALITIVAACLATRRQLPRQQAVSKVQKITLAVTDPLPYSFKTKPTGPGIQFYSYLKPGLFVDDKLPPSLLISGNVERSFNSVMKVVDVDGSVQVEKKWQSLPVRTQPTMFEDRNYLSGDSRSFTVAIEKLSPDKTIRLRFLLDFRDESIQKDKQRASATRDSLLEKLKTERPIQITARTSNEE